jgi:hypothetical protein
VNQSTTHFITQMKLRELHRQRENLRTAYRSLSDEVRAADSPGERLRRLYAGLRKITVAGQSLHPDVVNLELLLHELDTGVLSPDVSQNPSALRHVSLPHHGTGPAATDRAATRSGYIAGRDETPGHRD